MITDEHTGWNSGYILLRLPQNPIYIFIITFKLYLSNNVIKKKHLP